MNPITILLGLLILGLFLSGGAPETDVWTLEYPFNFITTNVERDYREKSVKFWKAAMSFSKKRRIRREREWSTIRGGRSSAPASRSLAKAVEKYWELSDIGNSNNIFIIPPWQIRQIEELEAKYPNLVSLPYDELKQYSYPLLYFARDTQTDRVRGLIIIDELDDSLAKLLAERGVPLDTPFRYENGQLQVLESPVEILASK